MSDRGSPVLRRIHHVAFAHAPGGGPGEPFERLFGLGPCHVEEIEGFVERMLPVGESYVQLLAATGPGVVQRFLDRRGPALHHIAFAVDDIDAAVRSLVEAGVRMVDGEPRPGGMGTRIAFAHPEAFGGLLVELVEEPGTKGGPGSTAG